jgi:hypothetical protein
MLMAVLLVFGSSTTVSSSPVVHSSWQYSVDLDSLLLAPWGLRLVETLLLHPQIVEIRILGRSAHARVTGMSWLGSVLGC